MPHILRPAERNGGSMTRTGMLLTIALSTGAMTTLAQQGQPADPERTPGVQAGQDPNRAAFIAAHCKNPPPPPAARGGGPGGPGGGRGAGAPAPQTPQD